MVLTYANSLSGPFILDDEATIVQNPGIDDLSQLREVLLPAPDTPVAGRPLASLSFAVNYAAGGLNVRGYHVVNIALHLACALLLWAIVRRTLARRHTRGASALDATTVAFAAALLWAVHPLNSEVVDYLSQRTESLMAGCYLLALYAAIRAAGDDDTGARQTGWTFVAVTACAAGALSKESIVTAPVMIAVYDRVFLFDSWRQAFHRRRLLYGGLLCSWAIVGLLVASAPRAAVAGFSSGVSPWTYLLNQAQVVTEYLRLTVWPDSLVAFYGWPRPLTLADVALPAAFLVGLIALTAMLLWWRPAMGFLPLWFFVTLAPASSIVPVATEVGAERRMYLPLAALAVIGVLLVHGAWQRVSRRADATAVPSAARAWIPAGVLMLIAVALAAVTMDRNREYASALSLVQTIVDRRPTAVAHHMLGDRLIAAGREDDAVPRLRRAVAEGNSRASYQLGQLLAKRGEHGAAIAQLEAFVRTYRPAQPLVPRWLEAPLAEVVPARFLLAREYGLQQDWARAAEHARAVLDLVPGHSGARGLLGDAMFARQQWREAANYYREYLARQPRDVNALINYGVAQVGLNDLDAGIEAFARAAALDPRSERAMRMLNMAQDDRARLAARTR